MTGLLVLRGERIEYLLSLLLDWTVRIRYTDCWSLYGDWRRRIYFSHKKQT